MRRLGNVLLTSALTVFLLSACETYQILTFEAHPNSFAKPGKLRLDLLGEQLRQGAAEQDRTTMDEYSRCVPPERLTPEVLPFLAPLAVGAASLAIESTSKAIQTWADARKKEFQTTSSAQANSNELLEKRSDGFYLSFSCIFLNQAVKSAKAGEPESGGFEFAAKVVTTDDRRAFKLIPTYYKLATSTAKTDAQSGKVQIAIKFSFDTVTINHNRELTKVSLGDVTVNIPGAELPKDTSEAKDHSAFSNPPDDAVGERHESAWILAYLSDEELSRCAKDASCKGLGPVTVGVTVTQTGTGSEAFGQLSTDLSSNTKTVDDAIKQVVQSALGGKAK